MSLSSRICALQQPYRLCFFTSVFVFVRAVYMHMCVYVCIYIYIHVCVDVYVVDIDVYMRSSCSGRLLGP